MLTHLAEFNPVTLRPHLLQGQKAKVSSHTSKYFVHRVLQRETLGTPLAPSSPDQYFLLVSRERTHVSPLSSVRLCPQVTGPGHWQLLTLQAVSFHLLPQRTWFPLLPVQSTVPVHTSSSFQCPPPSSVCMQFPEEVGCMGRACMLTSHRLTSWVCSEEMKVTANILNFCSPD